MRLTMRNPTLPHPGRQASPEIERIDMISSARSWQRTTALGVPWPRKQDPHDTDPALHWRRQTTFPSSQAWQARVLDCRLAKVEGLGVRAGVNEVIRGEER